MKSLPALLLLLGAFAAPAAEKLYLNPAAECGAFTTTRGEWATEMRFDVIKLGCDAQNLYVDACCHAAPGSAFVLSGKKDDDPAVFAGDVFELSIAPPGRNGDYYHLALNPAGWLYSAERRDTQWNPEGVVRSGGVSGNEWKFHLAVPFRALGATAPAPGDVWKINLARTFTAPGKGPVSASLSGASDYHDIRQFGEVVFGKKTPPGTIRLRSFDLAADHFSGEFVGDGLPPAVEGELFLDGKTVATQALSPRDGKLIFSGKLQQTYLPLKDVPSVRLVLRNAKTGAVLFQRENRVDLAEADRLRLDRYYYTAADRAVGYRQSFDDRDATLRLKRDGRVVRTIRNAAAAGAIPLAGTGAEPPLTPGRYVLEIQSGPTRTSRLFFLLDTPPVPPELPGDAVLKLTEHGFELGSRPIFLLGLAGANREFLQFKPAFNLADSAFGIQKNAVAITRFPGVRLIRKPFTGRLYPPTDQYLKTIDAYLAKQNPAQPVLHRISYEAQIPNAVTMPDGAVAAQDTDELMNRIYTHARQAASGLLYTIHTDKPDKIGALSRVGDLFEVACWSSSYAGNMVPQLRADMENVLATVPKGKKVIFWLGGTIPNPSCRLAEELRYGVYMSIAYGFVGNIIHMGHGFLPAERTRLWSLLSGINAEVQRFYPAFVRGKEAAGFVRRAPAGGFVWKAVDAGDVFLLLAINPNASENTLEMTVNARSVKPFGSTEETLLDHGLFRESFTPYEPRVFVFPK